MIFVEEAVSGQSTCRLCQSKIAKGTMRVAIHHFNWKYWNRYYYHKECMISTTDGKELLEEAQFKKSVLQGTKRKGDCISPTEIIELEAATVLKKKRISEATTVNDREDLRQMLKKLRTGIARRLQIAPFMVFHDSTLHCLVERLPCTTSELMDVPGFGVIKCQSLGPKILPLMRAFKRSLSDGTNNDTTSCRNPAAPPSMTLPGHDDDEEVIFESEVSIDDKISKNIREAEERGEVIEL